MPIGLRLLLPGSLSPTSLRSTAVDESSQWQENEKRRPDAATKNEQVIERNLPVPAKDDLSDGAKLPMPPLKCFGAGRKHSLNLL